MQYLRASHISRTRSRVSAVAPSTPSNNTPAQTPAFVPQRLPVLSMEEDERFAEDTSHDYRFEGAGSAAGSVGCCSNFGNDDDLGFLNTLGPKFKTLADVCKKT